MQLTLVHAWIALLLATAIGALPLFRKWSSGGLHVLVSISAGIFLGTVFLHLLPELAESVAATGAHDHAGHDHAGHDHAGHDHGNGHEGVPFAHSHGIEDLLNLGPWAAMLAGLLVLFVLEKVWLKARADKASDVTHTVLWSATYIGLALHALATGFALGPLFKDAERIFLVSILVHKVVEVFSLATVMRLANVGGMRGLFWIFVFGLITPIGLSLGALATGVDSELNRVLNGFACGTFLYVAVCDLLPEVFHGSKRNGWKLLAVLAGVALSVASFLA